MKKLFFKLSLLSLPFIIYWAWVIVIDPFNVLGYSNAIQNDLKEKNASILNEALWRVELFKEKAAPNILFGDSRMAFNIDSIKKITGEEYFNFSCGAGNIPEMISSFWYATKIIKPKEVYFGVNFELYNLSNNRDRVLGSIAIIDNPLIYFTNINVLEASFQIIKAYLSGRPSVVSTIPNMEKENFWKYQIDMSGTRYFNNYIYPEKYFIKLKEIVNYCKENNINITFIILPTHTDLQDLIITYNLTDSYERYLSDIKSLGEVYDFNFENSLTKNRDNFGDPFHVKSNILDTLTNIIWGREAYKNNNFVKHYQSDNFY